MNNENKNLILRSVKALQGEVVPSLRSVSVELRGKKIVWQCIFDANANDDDLELLSAASTELIADYDWNYTLEEILQVIPNPNEMVHLENLIYLRHEKNYYK